MSLRFDRVNNQYIQVGDVTTFKWLHGAENPTGFKWSVSFWTKVINPSLPTSSQVFLTTDAGTTHLNSGASVILFNNVWLGVTYTRAILVDIGCGASENYLLYCIVDNAYPNDSNWHHIVVTYDQSLSANNCKVYVDGVLVGYGTKTGLSPSTSNSTYPMWFGRTQRDDYPHGLDGFLEDLRFYKDRVLTADEVKVIAKSKGRDGIVGNLFARYLFKDGYDGEPTGRTVLLLHGDGPEGSKAIKDYAYGNKAVTVVGNACVIEGVNKFGGSAIKFDGASYLSLADSDDWWFGSGDFTIDFWVRVLRLPIVSTAYNIVRQFSTLDNYWRVYLTHTLGVGFKWIVESNSGGVRVVDINALTLISENVWYHIAVIRSSNTWMVFQNGQVIHTEIDSDALPNVAAPLEIGRATVEGNTGLFYGYLDEFRITKGAARWTSNFTLPHQEYFSEIAEISGKRLYTFVSSASAPRYRGGELVTQRRYRRW